VPITIPIGTPPIFYTINVEKWTRPLAVTLAYVWKFHTYDQWPLNSEVQQAVGFTKFGYDREVPITPNLNRQCPPSLTRCSASRFDWAWEPAKPRILLPGINL